MATVTSSTTDADGNITYNVSAEEDDTLPLATAGTYVDKNIIFKINVSTKGIDTTDATATAEDIMSGKTAYVADEKIEGTYVPETFETQTKTVTPTEEEQTITPDTDYDGLSSVTIDAISDTYVGSSYTLIESGKVGTDYSISNDSPTGDFYLKANKNLYLPSGSSAKIISLTTQSGGTYTPTTSDQIVARGDNYLINNVTIKGDANLVASNIAQGTSIFGVTGSYTSDADATEANIQKGKTAYVNGVKLTGTHEEGTFTTEELTITPSESEQIFTPTTNGYSKVTASAISNTYIGSSVPNANGSIDSSYIGGKYVNSIISYTEVDGYNGSTTDTPYSTDGIGIHCTVSEKSYLDSGDLYILTSIKDQMAKTFTPTTTDQIIPAGIYLSANQTILGDANLVPANIANGVTIFGVTGTHEGGIDTSDADATATDILSGKTAYVNGVKITGSISTRTDDKINGSGLISNYPTYLYFWDATNSSGITSDLTGSGGYYYISSDLTKGFYIRPGFLSTLHTITPGITNGTFFLYSNSSKIWGWTLPTGTASAGGTLTPGTADVTISAGQWINSDYTIKGDTNLVAENIAKDVTIFGVTGTLETGSSSSLDTSDATAEASDIVSGKTAYVNGTKITGTLVYQSYYTGEDVPDADLGEDGDFYFKTTSGGATTGDEVGTISTTDNSISLTSSDLASDTYTLYYEDASGNKLEDWSSIGTITT